MRCVTIGDVDLVPTLEEYDCFLSFSTPLSTIFVPLVCPHYCKRLANLLGLKRPIMEALTMATGKEEACPLIFFCMIGSTHWSVMLAIEMTLWI